MAGYQHRFTEFSRELADFGDVRADERCGLLIHRTITSTLVIGLEMSERRCRRNRVGFILSVVVKRHVKERIVRKAQNDVTHVVRLRVIQFLEDAFDTILILVGRGLGLRCVTRYQSLLHVRSFRRREHLVRGGL